MKTAKTAFKQPAFARRARRTTSPRGQPPDDAPGLIRQQPAPSGQLHRHIAKNLMG